MDNLVNDLISHLKKSQKLVLCYYKKGECIIHQGQILDSIYYLADGKCYRESLTENGDEIIYDVRYSEGKYLDKLLGILVLYSKNRMSTTSFVAKTNCICYKISEEIFLDYANQHPELLHELLRMSVNGYDTLDSKYHLRQEGKVANGLCEIIIEHIVVKDNDIYSEVMNNSELAKSLGVHRVSVVRILKQLEEECIIKRSKKGMLILNKDQLKEYAMGKKFIYTKNQV